MLQASLKGELEGNQQQLESSKVTEPALPSKTSLCNPFWRNMQFYKSTFDQQIEVCELTAERHRLQEQLRSALEQQQRTSSSLQQCINGLQQERDTAKVYTHTHTHSICHTHWSLNSSEWSALLKNTSAVAFEMLCRRNFQLRWLFSLLISNLFLISHFFKILIKMCF